MKRCRDLIRAAVPCAAAVREPFENIPVPTAKLEAIESSPQHSWNSRPKSVRPADPASPFTSIFISCFHPGHLWRTHTVSRSKSFFRKEAVGRIYYTGPAVFILLQKVNTLLDFLIIGRGHKQGGNEGRGGRKRVLVPFLTSQRANFQNCY